MSKALAGLLAVLFMGWASAADPPVPLKPVVIDRTVSAAGVEVPAVQLDVWETSQRYVAIKPTTAEILTFDYTDPNVVEVINRSPTEKFYGVPFDSPPGTKSADKAFPDAKGMVAIVVGKNPGTCTVSVWTVKNGTAVKIDTILIQVGPRPPPPSPITLTATPSTGTAPLTVQFTATGETAGGVLEFGDGTQATAFFPAHHSYGTAGTYTAKLTAGGKVVSAVVVVSGTPVPPVVTSFRVIYVTESAKNLTKTQNAVINAAETVAYLNSKCTKTNNWPDFRAYDPQSPAEKDYPGLAQMWAAAKPAITTVPCVAIQVNDKVTIEPFPASVADALTLFKKYGGS
jgi:PKD repeat protein